MNSLTGVVERQRAFLHQDQDRDAGQRLRLRRDAKDRVGRHLPGGFLVAPADRALIHRAAVAEHQPDRAGNAIVVDVLLEQLVDPRQAIGVIGGRRNWGSWHVGRPKPTRSRALPRQRAGAVCACAAFYTCVILCSLFARLLACLEDLDEKDARVRDPGRGPAVRVRVHDPDRRAGAPGAASRLPRRHHRLQLSRGHLDRQRGRVPHPAPDRPPRPRGLSRASRRTDGRSRSRRIDTAATTCSWCRRRAEPPSA